MKHTRTPKPAAAAPVVIEHLERLSVAELEALLARTLAELEASERWTLTPKGRAVLAAAGA
ncbi:MAG: hypothetical protein ACRDI2_08245 [Chloroflexota bacterium]